LSLPKGIQADPAIDASSVLSVAHVLATVDDLGAGPSASVPALARALRDQGAAVRLHTILGWRGNPPSLQVADLHVFRHEATRGPLGRVTAHSGQLRAALFDEARTAHVIHSHGLWLAPNTVPADAIRQTGSRARLVLSPRGMLGREALAFSAYRKKLMWALSQHRAVQQAHCLHATATSELEEIRAAGLTQPVAVIPNGIDLPTHEDRRGMKNSQRTVLSLGRLHPKKGLDRLIAAWAQIEGRYPDWRLRIVGPPENGYDNTLRQLQSDLGLSSVSIEGAAFGDEKARAYQNADLFVLPTLNENFAMTVAEALSHSVPVIATKGAPWAGLESEGCGWWIDHGQTPLIEALSSAMSMRPDQLASMGARGRQWMARDFAWQRVGTDMLDVYQWLTGRRARPDCVSID
jgi:glycosyltransferase involved in cell wall biosynthesis